MNSSRAIFCVFIAGGLTGLTPAEAGTPQTLTFPGIPDKLSTAPAFAPGAVTDSGLPVNYTIVSPPGVAVVSGGMVTLTGAPGSVTIRAGQPGDASHDPAPDVYRTFTVGLASQRFVKVVCGRMISHVWGIRADGTLWGWGDNKFCDLGDGSCTRRSEPVRVGGAGPWMAVASSSTGVAGLMADGTLWQWGRHTRDSDPFPDRIPIQSGNASDWASLSTGGAGLTAVKTDGTLMTWGDNPVPVGSDHDWRAASGGGGHSVALKTDDSLWAWGGNEYGQLGDGSTQYRPVPVRIGNENHWASVSCGDYHTVALRNDGALAEWGYGTGSLAPVVIGMDRDWVRHACGSGHTLALKSDGSLWAWGRNLLGELGDGSTTERARPVRIGTAANWESVAAGYMRSAGIRADGTLWMWTWAEGETAVSPVPIAANERWLSAGGGWMHTAAVRADGTLWAWGGNTYGQLGDGTTVPRGTPVRIGDAASWTRVVCSAWDNFALRADGSLWAWGWGSSAMIPTRIGTDADWIDVSAGLSGHVLARKEDGTLWAWGDNHCGQLGDGTQTDRSIPGQVGTGAGWAVVSCGECHVLAVKSDGTLWAWGDNSLGQLGDGSTGERLTPAAIGTGRQWRDAAAGEVHSVAVAKDGTLWGWGTNYYGQVGDGTFMERTSPVRIGSDADWVSVSCRRHSSVARKADGSLWAWGYNASGQLGDGTTTNRNAPVRIGIGTNWAMVSCAEAHVTGIRTDGTLWTWGGDFPGLLADGQLVEPRRTWPPRAPQTITLPAPGRLVTGVPVTLQAAASSGLPVEYLITGPATLHGRTLTATGPGTVRIYTRAAGDSSWLASETVEQTVSALTPLQTWRETHFGTAATDGSAADDADPDGDGVANLVEWACGTNPTAGVPLLLKAVWRGDFFEFTYPRSIAAMESGAAISVEWSDSLTGEEWSSAGVTEEISGSDGIVQQVRALVPAAGRDRRFVHLKIVSPW